MSYSVFFTIVAVHGDRREEKVFHHLITGSDQYEFYGGACSIRSRFRMSLPVHEAITSMKILAHSAAGHTPTPPQKADWARLVGTHPDSLIHQYTSDPDDILEFGELPADRADTFLSNRVKYYEQGQGYDYVSDANVIKDLIQLFMEK